MCCAICSAYRCAMAVHNSHQHAFLRKLRHKQRKSNSFKEKLCGGRKLFHMDVTAARSPMASGGISRTSPPVRRRKRKGTMTGHEKPGSFLHSFTSLYPCTMSDHFLSTHLIRDPEFQRKGHRFDDCPDAERFCKRHGKAGGILADDGHLPDANRVLSVFPQASTLSCCNQCPLDRQCDKHTTSKPFPLFLPSSATSISLLSR